MSILNKIQKVLHKEGVRGLTRRVWSILTGNGMHGLAYAYWIKDVEQVFLKSKEANNLISSVLAKPLISIVMPVYNPPADFLVEAIESVLAQSYTNWELCMADDNSPNKEIPHILEKYAKQDPRIKVTLRSVNGHISEASNSALSLATGEFIALLDHDDLLNKDALSWVAYFINKFPSANLFYSDEDKLSPSGKRINPYFKSDWNPLLFLGHNLITHLGVYRKTLIDEIGGFRKGFEGAQDYDLAARVICKSEDSQIIHIPLILYHWRMLEGSTALAIEGKTYAVEAGERAVTDFMSNRGYSGKVTGTGKGQKVLFELPNPIPLVSIIIPSKNKTDLLDTCLRSIFEKSTYPHFEVIIVDNQSDIAEDLAYLDQVSNIFKSTKVIKGDYPFNFSKLINDGARQANGSFLILLNNDTEIISADWIDHLISIANQPNVGAVGAMLLYPDLTVQHGGVILGIAGFAGHAHKYFDSKEAGYMGRLLFTQNYSAVTGACLAIRKDHFEAVGGLDELNFKVAFNDVDFCLRLKSKLNLLSAWTPDAKLFHHESKSRGSDLDSHNKARFEEEVNKFKTVWGAYLKQDPCYNPNLTLEEENFSFAKTSDSLKKRLT